MELLPGLFDGLVMLWGTCAEPPGQRTSEIVVLHQLPEVLLRVRETFGARASQGWVWLCVGGTVLLAAFIVGWIRYAGLRKTGPSPGDNPEGLFRELLDQLPLAAADKKLLRQMAAGARLQHPAMSLLSPGLLDWTCRLWECEKGPRVVTAAKIARLRSIGVRLYDHDRRN